MKTLQLIVIIFCALMISAGLTALAYSTLTVRATQTIPYEFELSDHSTFNLANDKIYFGSTIPGSGLVIRHATVSNSDKYPVRVEIKAFGELSDQVRYSENYFELQPGETKNIDLMIGSEYGTPFGEYSGFVKIIYKRIW